MRALAELAPALRDDAVDAVGILRCLLAGHRAPDAAVGATGSLHGCVDIGLAGLGDLSQDLFGGRVDRLEPGAGAVDELTVDEQAVGRLDVDDAARLGGGCIVEGSCRSEARRVGKECVSTCRSRWSP